MYRVFLISLFLVSSAAHASNITELEKRNIADVERPNGKNIEMEVVKNFWGDAKFMMQCVPPGSPIHEPFTIYIEILKTGKIGQLAFTLDTKATKCIESFVRKKQFIKPENPFVAKIKLSFKE